MQKQQVVEFTLPNGSTALARATAVDGVGATKAGAIPKFDFDGVSQTLQGLAEAVQAALAEVKPNKTTVEFGLELALRNGKLSGLVVEGEGKGSLVVTLEWDS